MVTPPVFQLRLGSQTPAPRLLEEVAAVEAPLPAPEALAPDTFEPASSKPAAPPAKTVPSSPQALLKQYGLWAVGALGATTLALVLSRGHGTAAGAALKKEKLPPPPPPPPVVEVLKPPPVQEPLSAPPVKPPVKEPPKQRGGGGGGGGGASVNTTSIPPETEVPHTQTQKIESEEEVQTQLPQTDPNQEASTMLLEPSNPLAGDPEQSLGGTIQNPSPAPLVPATTQSTGIYVEETLEPLLDELDVRMRGTDKQKALNAWGAAKTWMENHAGPWGRVWLQALGVHSANGQANWVPSELSDPKALKAYVEQLRARSLDSDHEAQGRLDLLANPANKPEYYGKKKPLPLHPADAWAYQGVGAKPQGGTAQHEALIDEFLLKGNWPNYMLTEGGIQKVQGELTKRNVNLGQALAMAKHLIEGFTSVSYPDGQTYAESQEPKVRIAEGLANNRFKWLQTLSWYTRQLDHQAQDTSQSTFANAAEAYNTMMLHYNVATLGALRGEKRAFQNSEGQHSFWDYYLSKAHAIWHRYQNEFFAAGHDFDIPHLVQELPPPTPTQKEAKQIQGWIEPTSRWDPTPKIIPYRDFVEGFEADTAWEVDWASFTMGYNKAKADINGVATTLSAFNSALQKLINIPQQVRWMMEARTLEVEAVQPNADNKALLSRTAALQQALFAQQQQEHYTNPITSELLGDCCTVRLALGDKEPTLKNYAKENYRTAARLAKAVNDVVLEYRVRQKRRPLSENGQHTQF